MGGTEGLTRAHSRWAKLTEINQLIILCNFATLLIKSNQCIVASEQIAEQWHKGVGTHFARQIQALAHHYQRFEQLSPKK